NYNQPDAGSVALNRILSQSGSEIRGRINANGHVVLINSPGYRVSGIIFWHKTLHFT
ncbi:filamentous hemagglutinin N-terminal domain-containing protein, partial [Marinimicrobium locisalis]|uniref:filamentous hemagglutinin N-terminal domain-containing protein n=1 Tax=Marinimicrobium locisalis TaxID=546022 RepID=UPI0032218B5C